MPAPPRGARGLLRGFRGGGNGHVGSVVGGVWSFNGGVAATSRYPCGRYPTRCRVYATPERLLPAVVSLL